MASFKHEASYSHNKCETAWKLILFLPETVEIKIICIKVQKRLRGITWTMWLQHRRTGWNDGSLAWGMDCFELELWAHPQASMRPGVSHYFNLWEDGEMLNKNLQYTEWFLQYTEPPESCCSQAKRVFCAISSEKAEQGKIRNAFARERCCSQSQELLAEPWKPLNCQLGDTAPQVLNCSEDQQSILAMTSPDPVHSSSCHLEIHAINLNTKKLLLLWQQTGEHISICTYTE